jgi:hypothetical protein
VRSEAEAGGDLAQLLARLFGGDEVDVGDAPRVGEGAVAGEQGALLALGAAGEGGVVDVRLVERVEAEQAEPEREAAEHRVDGEARRARERRGGRGAADPRAAAAVQGAAALEARGVVGPAAAGAGNLRGALRGHRRSAGA